MSENTIQSSPKTGPWWFVWMLICTVVVPATMLGALASMPKSEVVNPVWMVAGIFVLVLHLVASIQLSKGRSVWVALGLIIGGWFLMLASCFVGCLVLVSMS